MPRFPRASRRGLVAAAALVLALLLAPSGATGAEGAGPYLYTDASGSTRMVQTLDEVPVEHRARARALGATRSKVEYQPRVTTVTPERAARARERAQQAASAPERRPDTVLFYTASSCGYCDLTRSYLDEQGIAFEERSIDEPAIQQELIGKIGKPWVPMVEHGSRRVIGWDPAGIDALGL
jgi:glutaredoxin